MKIFYGSLFVKHPKIKIIILTCTVLFASTFTYQYVTRPMIYLYAWERPESFSFLKGMHRVGVAYFALHIELYDDHITTHRRASSLVIPDNIISLPVIRVDMLSPKPEHYDTAFTMIADLCNSSIAQKCQIDFDITESQEAFFRTFMKQLATKINPTIQLTATALPYRCYRGDFYHDIPVKYVVPLLVNVGNDATYLTHQTKKHDLFLGEKCQEAIGVSTYEATYKRGYFKHKEVYLFPNTSWTQSLFEKMIRTYSLR